MNYCYFLYQIQGCLEECNYTNKCNNLNEKHFICYFLFTPITLASIRIKSPIWLQARKLRKIIIAFINLKANYQQYFSGFTVNLE